VTLALLRDLRAAVVLAREALEKGEPEFATAVLLDLEDEIGRVQADAIARKRQRGHYECADCGARFEWPGLLDAHQRRVHAAEGSA
jgi:hypothetical protein